MLRGRWAARPAHGMHLVPGNRCGPWAPALIAALVLCGCSRARPALPAVAADGKQRGMCYEFAWPPRSGLGYGSAASERSLTHLKNLGITWISITPFGFMRSPTDTVIRWSGARIVENDSSLVATTRQAHALGIAVMLKPHLWLRPPLWVGQISMTTGEAWRAWFRAYTAFILHYATLALRGGMDGFVVGNELGGTSRREAEWRSLIARVRSIYHGPLTYGAGMNEVFDVPFWDALDFIGVSGYYPLVDARSPDRALLEGAWVPIADRLRALSLRWNRRVIFTELGYRSSDYAAWKQWEIPREAEANPTVQSEAYAAFLEAVWPQPWCAGVYWWKWPSSDEGGGTSDNDYTPIHKPAEDILRHFWYASRIRSILPPAFRVQRNTPLASFEASRRPRMSKKVRTTLSRKGSS